MTLLRWSTFLLRSHTVILTVWLFWIHFFLSSSTMAFPPLGNPNHVFVSVSIDFPSYLQWDPPFHRISYDHSCVAWDEICDHLRNLPWEDIFKLSVSAASSEFCEWFQVRIAVYIPHQRYQAKSHWISLVFSCLCCIVHRNHFLNLYQKDTSFESKVKFRQASNRCKRVLEVVRLA